MTSYILELVYQFTHMYTHSRILISIVVVKRVYYRCRDRKKSTKEMIKENWKHVERQLGLIKKEED